MRVECISDTNFQGKVVKTGKNFSAKPQQNLANAEKPINDLIKSKPFDLYVHQDYSNNEIVFETDLVGISKRIPITAKASKYIETAKNTIEEHENRIASEKEEMWIKEQNKENLKDLCITVLYFALIPFLMLAHDIKEGIKSSKITINKLAKNFAAKKG